MPEHPAVAFLTAALAHAEETAKAACRHGASKWKTAEHPSDTRAVIDDLGEAVVYDEGWPSEEQAEHIALHDPAAVLRRVASDRALLADFQAEQHQVVDDPWYTCAAATEERDGARCMDTPRAGGPCDCGRDARVERRVLLLAEAWGWTEEDTK